MYIFWVRSVGEERCIHIICYMHTRRRLCFGGKKRLDLYRYTHVHETHFTHVISLKNNTINFFIPFRVHAFFLSFLYDFQIVKFIKSITERVFVLIISLSESLKRVLCVKKGSERPGGGAECKVESNWATPGALDVFAFSSSFIRCLSFFFPFPFPSSDVVKRERVEFNIQAPRV